MKIIYNVDECNELLNKWSKWIAKKQNVEKLKQKNDDFYEHDGISELKEKLNLEYVFNGKKMIDYRYYNNNENEEEKEIGNKKEKREDYIKFTKGKIPKTNKIEKGRRSTFEIDSYCKKLKTGTEHDGAPYHNIIKYPFIKDEIDLVISLAKDRDRTSDCIKKGIFMVRIPYELTPKDAMKLYLFGPEDIEGVSHQYITVENNELIPILDKVYENMDSGMKKNVLAGYKLDREPRYYHLCGTLNQKNINSKWFDKSKLVKYIENDNHLNNLKEIKLDYFNDLDKYHNKIIHKVEFNKKYHEKIERNYIKIHDWLESSDELFVKSASEEIYTITESNSVSYNLKLLNEFNKKQDNEILTKMVVLESSSSPQITSIAFLQKNNDKITKKFKGELFDSIKEFHDYRYYKFIDWLESSKNLYVASNNEDLIKFFGSNDTSTILRQFNNYLKRPNSEILTKIVAIESGTEGIHYYTSICFLKKNLKKVNQKFNGELFDTIQESQEYKYHKFHDWLSSSEELFVTTNNKQVMKYLGSNNPRFIYTQFSEFSKRPDSEIMFKIVPMESKAGDHANAICFLKKNLEKIKIKFKGEVYDTQEDYFNSGYFRFRSELQNFLFITANSDNAKTILKMNDPNNIVHTFNNYKKHSKGEISVKLVSMNSDSGIRFNTICLLSENLNEIKKRFDGKVFDEIKEFQNHEYNELHDWFESSDKLFVTDMNEKVKEILGYDDENTIHKKYCDFAKRPDSKMMVKLAIIRKKAGNPIKTICFLKKNHEKVKKKFKGEIFDTIIEFQGNKFDKFNSWLNSSDILFVKTTDENLIDITGSNDSSYNQKLFSEYSKKSKGKIMVKLAVVESESSPQITTICFLKKRIDEINKKFKGEIFDSMKGFQEHKYNKFHNWLESIDKLFVTTDDADLKDITNTNHAKTNYKIFLQHSKKSKGEILVKVVLLKSKSGYKKTTICFLRKNIDKVSEHFNGELFDNIIQLREGKYKFFKNTLEKSEKIFFTANCKEAASATRLIDRNSIVRAFAHYSKKSDGQVIYKYCYIVKNKVTNIQVICLLEKNLYSAKEILGDNIFDSIKEARKFKKENPNMTIYMD